jgi:hypothetical protein
MEASHTGYDLKTLEVTTFKMNQMGDNDEKHPKLAIVSVSTLVVL